MNKTKYNKKLILEKAFQIAAEDGFENITVRKVTKAIGCSTTPIYTAFENIENLIKATKKKALEIIKEVVTKKYTDIEFLNIGVGMLMFATKYPNLYRELFVEKPDVAVEREVRGVYLKLLEKDLIAKYMTTTELENILSKMWLVTHGVGTMICYKSTKASTQEDFINILGEIGEEIIIATLIRNGNIGKYQEDFVREGCTRVDRNYKWDIWR